MRLQARYVISVLAVAFAMSLALAPAALATESQELLQAGAVSLAVTSGDEADAGSQDSSSAIADISGAVIKVKDVVYSGSAAKPAVKVTLDGKRLVKDRDFTVKYSSNKKVGTAKVTIKGKGNFAGEKTKRFKIVPKGCYISDIESITNTKKGGFRVRWTKRTKSVTGYQICYSLSDSFKSAKSKKYKLSSKQAKACQATLYVPSSWRGKTVYVQARTYKVVNGKTYSSDWSASELVNISLAYGSVPKGCPVTSFVVDGKNYVHRLMRESGDYRCVDYDVSFKKGDKVEIKTRANWVITSIEVDSWPTGETTKVERIKNGSRISGDSIYIGVTVKNKTTGDKKVVSVGGFI